MLNSPEEEVLSKACEALYKFAAKGLFPGHDISAHVLYFHGLINLPNGNTSINNYSYYLIFKWQQYGRCSAEFRVI